LALSGAIGLIHWMQLIAQLAEEVFQLKGKIHVSRQLEHRKNMISSSLVFKVLAIDCKNKSQRLTADMTTCLHFPIKKFAWVFLCLATPE
jgi:phosphoglycerate-specific signal transduction histidine kinase